MDPDETPNDPQHSNHAPSPSLQPGAIVDEKYELKKFIGMGGMGAVYSAVHLQLGTDVAIKVLHPRFGVDQESVARFQREARIIASLRHANILSVYSFNSWQGIFYIAMELIEGDSLVAYIFDGDRLRKPEDKLPLLIQVCRAMSFAHKNGVLHRDLKPDNVLVVNNPDGSQSAKVVDFGLAKLQGATDVQQLTRTGEVFGDPNYMSPEQCQGKPLDERSDIYSFGCLMYELFSGVRPFEADTPLGTLYKHLQDNPQRFAKQVGISSALEEIIFRAMEKSREQRYESFDEIAADLSRFIDNPQLKASSSVPPGGVSGRRPAVHSTASDTNCSAWRKVSSRVMLIVLCLLPAVTAAVVLMTRRDAENDGGHAANDDGRHGFVNLSQLELRTRALELCSRTALLVARERFPETETNLAELDQLRLHLEHQPYVEAQIDFLHGWYQLQMYRRLKVPADGKNGVNYLRRSLQEYDQAYADASASGGEANKTRLDEIATHKFEAADHLRYLGIESDDAQATRQGALEVIRLVRHLPDKPDYDQLKALQQSYDVLIQMNAAKGNYERALKLMWRKLTFLERQGCDPAFVASERKRLEVMINELGGAKALTQLSPGLEAEIRKQSALRHSSAPAADPGIDDIEK